MAVDHWRPGDLEPFAGGSTGLIDARPGALWLSSSGDDSDQIAPAMGSLQRFLAEEAAGAMGRHGGAMSHERSASAASRNVWLLMAAW